jgi:hypothetical protein
MDVCHHDEAGRHLSALFARSRVFCAMPVAFLGAAFMPAWHSVGKEGFGKPQTRFSCA